jgi:CHAT domain-containing protein
VRRLIVSPDGALALVPFPALAPDLEVTLVPSATTHRLLEDLRPAAGSDVLALGDPDYGSPASARVPATLRAGHLLPLPATREEALAVGDTVLLRERATEAALGEALRSRPRWKALHLACHGLVDAARPLQSSLAITPDPENDGFWTALDVLRTPVPADLVVLSACETGRGRVVAGEGLVGLSRAFFHAGASTVLCSLWKVDDDATRALMTKFYALWNPRPGSGGKGTPSEAGVAPDESRGPKDGAGAVGPAAALRAAQAHVREQASWKAPRYWAAWVLWGLGDPPVRR